MPVKEFDFNEVADLEGAALPKNQLHRYFKKILCIIKNTIKTYFC